MNKQERNESARAKSKKEKAISTNRPTKVKIVPANKTDVSGKQLPLASELNSGRAQVDDDLRQPMSADSYSEQRKKA